MKPTPAYGQITFRVLMVCFGCGMIGCTTEDRVHNASVAPVEVDLSATVVDDRLVIEYSVTNQTDSPIFLLDRQLDFALMAEDDRKKSKTADRGNILDADWADTEVVKDGWWSHKIVIRREIYRYPDSVCDGATILPLARRLDAGAKVSDKLGLPLPLDQQDAETYSTSSGEARYDKVTIDSVQFEIGWLPSFPPQSKPPYVSESLIETEMLWYMFPSTYRAFYALQQLSISKPVPVQCEAFKLKHKEP